jgi:hypothetical protein
VYFRSDLGVLTDAPTVTREKLSVSLCAFFVRHFILVSWLVVDSKPRRRKM